MAAERRRAVTRWGAAVAGAFVVATLAVVGVTAGSGPDSTTLAPARQVVVLSVPGLRWQDLAASETPAIDALLGGSALLSVRAIGPETSLVEGYLTLNAGNRLEVDAASVEGATPEEGAAGWCLADLAAAATASADDGLDGAEPGALGSALSAAGLSTAVYGRPEALAALMDGAGCVDDYHEAGQLPAFSADVTLIEYTGLDIEQRAAERLMRLGEIEAAITALDVPTAAMVIVLAPSAVDSAAEVTVVAVSEPDARRGEDVGSPRSLVSPSTRRAARVTLTDVAPTVLDAVGAAVPDAMSGTVIGTASSEQSAVDGQVSWLADLAERVEFRDRAVGPVIVLLVVLLVLCGVAGLARRHRLARLLAPIALAHPTVTFLFGLSDYHQVSLALFVVVVAVTSMVLAWVVVAFAARLGPGGPTSVLATLLWLVLVVDVVTGGRLQIDTPLGYTPTVAGRFQGFGNLAFGLVAAAALVVALLVMMWPDPVASLGASPAGWATFVGGITVVAVAAPAFGSDVGGTLAVVPAFAVVVLLVAGRRVSWRVTAVTALATAALVTLLAVADLARPADQRTHLGRFLDELLHGGAGLIVRRKLHGNLAILTSSPWSLALVLVIVGAFVVAWRDRERLRAYLADRAVVRVFLAGFAPVAFLGFALNDSGLAVPAVMGSVAVPWLVGQLVPVTKRAGR